MQKKELHVEYLTYEENNQFVAFAPHLDLCFNSESKKSSLDSLKTGAKLLTDFWKEKNVLVEKIEKLGLNGTASEEKKEIIQLSLSIPYYILKHKPEQSDFSFEVEIP